MGRKSLTSRSSLSASEPSSKPNGKGAKKAATASKKPEPELESEPGSESQDEEDDGDSDESDDIDEEGMQNLMAALKRQGVELPTGEEDDSEDDEDEDEEDDEDEGDEDEEGDEDDEAEAEDAEAEKKSSKPTLAESILRSGLVPAGSDGEEDDEDEDEAGSSEGEEGEDDAVEVDQVQGDLPPAVLATKHNRIRINNVAALKAITESIALNGPTKGAPLAWTETMDVNWPEDVTVEVGASIEDDLKRELVFYRQALAGAEEGRRRLAQAGVPFIRPKDYFAEMVKSDEHMERVRQRMLDERAGIKASEEAKRQRELKKFGKKVQVEKQLERQKQKREFADKIKDLKRKHSGGDDEFDVQLADAMEGEEASRPARGGPAGRGRGRGGKKSMPRSARDAKYGYGGKKKHSKANTRESTENFSFGGRGGSAGGPAKKRRISGTAGVRAPASKKNRPGKNARAGRR